MALYLTDDSIADDVKGRHVDRYRTAIMMVGYRGGAWLDAACGSGYGTRMMAELADHTTGMDRDADAIAYAREHYQPPVDEFIHRDILAPNLSIYGARFNVVISVETIEHLDQTGQAAWIRKVATELLTPTGIFVLTCPLRVGGGPNPKNPKHLWEPDETELRNQLSLYFPGLSGIVHTTPMTTGEVQPNLYIRCER